jgi:bifunctional non-homologous end joining protein LigD
MASVRPSAVKKAKGVAARPVKGAADGVEGATRAAHPSFVEPSLCQLVAAAPMGDAWVHEAKFDGYRLQAALQGGKATLYTRRGVDWTEKFRIVAKAISALPARQASIDGELVVLDDRGVPNFTALKHELGNPNSPHLVFYAFDLLHLDGYDLREAALLDRKRLLANLLRGQPLDGALRYSEHFASDGAAMLANACRMGLEGIVSKRLDVGYRSGRGMHWLKAKCSARQEFVIAGWRPSENSSSQVGSLVLGVYQGGKLHHVGRVGTGYTATVAADLAKRLNAIKAAVSPFSERLTGPQRRDVIWARPELVAEIELRGWTGDGHIRHGAFKGLREDKDPREVVRERVPDAN